MLPESRKRVKMKVLDSVLGCVGAFSIFVLILSFFVKNMDTFAHF